MALHLANRLLAGGYAVHLVDNFLRGVQDEDLRVVLARPEVTFSEIDCLDAAAVAHLPTDFDYIFHLAAIIGVGHVEERPADVVTDNLYLLENLLDHADRQDRLTRFMFPSTSEVYAGTLEHFDLPIPTPESTPLAVTDLCRPRTSYLLSKVCGEALCHFRPVPTTIFRPHNVYGPRMGTVHVVPGQLKKAYEYPAGSAIPVPSIEQTRTFCYVDDAVEMLMRMMESPACEGQTMNLGNQEPEVTIREVVEICYRTVGKNQSIDPKPAPAGSPARRCPDMSQTISLIGDSPSVSLEEGIRRTYDWYVRHVFDGRGISAQ